MAVTESAKKVVKEMAFESESEFMKTDKEFMERFHHFAFDEVKNEEGKGLEDRTRRMAILAVLLGCQGIEAFRECLPEALEAGVTPVEAKEIVYQAVPYLGFGRVYPFLQATNEVLTKRGVALPVEGQATTTIEARLEAGIQTQVDIFGDRMKDFYRSGPEESRHINKWLADNCFGDYYTRTGLDVKQREMLTFCYLLAQGGCESQLTSHAAANMRIGNGKQFLINVISQCVPFIGYPRSLNALRCVNEAAAAEQ